jgi:hypothetical protein
MSPAVLLARTLAWWRATFAKRCDCPPLDVRIESGHFECGRCGKPIEARA